MPNGLRYGRGGRGDSADLLKQKRVRKSPLIGGDKPRPVHAVLGMVLTADAP